MLRANASAPLTAAGLQRLCLLRRPFNGEKRGEAGSRRTRAPQQRRRGHANNRGGEEEEEEGGASMCPIRRRLHRR